MKTYITFISNDLKIIFRDKTMAMIAFLPIILIMVCRFLVPFIATYVTGFEGYYWMILAAFCILSGSTPAFLSAFLMLDEKDENLVPVLKVTPVQYSNLIASRISFLMAFSFISSLLFLLFNGLQNTPFGKIIMSSILVSFVPAILLLFILPFAKNKIEGVTLFKGVNVVLFIPIAAFFVPVGWKMAFGVLPFYWVYELLNAETISFLTTFLKIFLPGFGIAATYFLLLIKFFNKRFVRT